MNQQSSGKKPNPENTPPTGEDPKKKKGFNIYWIYGIIFLGLVLWQFVKTPSGSGGILTDQQKFYEMVKQGDVEKIKTIRNSKKVRVFLYKDSLIKKSCLLFISLK